MIVREGIDSAFGRRPDTDLVLQLQQAGKSFIVRYLSHFPEKALTAEEVNLYRRTGMDLAVVFEDSAGRALAGDPAGRFDAAYVAEQVRALGGPEDAPVYFAVDFQMTQTQRQAVVAYVNGACRVLGGGRVGVYGSYDVIRACQQETLARYFWQTYAWSNRKWAGGVHLQQYLNGQLLAGANVDFNRAMSDDFGQWEWNGMTMSDKQDILDAIATLSRKVDQVYGILEDGGAHSKGHVGLRDVARKVDDARSDLDKISEVVSDISRDVVTLLPQAPAVSRETGDDGV